MLHRGQFWRQIKWKTVTWKPNPQCSLYRFRIINFHCPHQNYCHLLLSSLLRRQIRVSPSELLSTRPQRITTTVPILHQLHWSINASKIPFHAINSDRTKLETLKNRYKMVPSVLRFPRSDICDISKHASLAYVVTRVRVHRFMQPSHSLHSYGMPDIVVRVQSRTTGSLEYLSVRTRSTSCSFLLNEGLAPSRFDRS